MKHIKVNCLPAQINWLKHNTQKKLQKKSIYGIKRIERILVIIADLKQ